MIRKVRSENGRFAAGNPGRSPGSLNKRTLALRSRLWELGAHPEVFLAHVMLGDEKVLGFKPRPEHRIEAAAKLMHYVWPKLKAVEHQVEAGPLRIVVKGLELPRR